MDKIKDYFKRYPTSGEVFENGGKLFHTRGGADSFGKGETKRYTRKEAEAGKADTGTGSTDTEKASATALLRETEDISALDYNTAKKLVKDLGLKAENQKQETFAAVLAEYKTTLTRE